MARDRIEILSANEMQHADRQTQRLFWQRYNLRRGRPAAALGVLADRLLADQRRGLPAAKRLGRVAEAWRAVVPDSLVAVSAVEAFRGGKVTVRVDGAATRFALSREIGETLLAALRGVLADLRIDRIDYVVGGGGANGSARGADGLPPVGMDGKRDGIDGSGAAVRSGVNSSRGPGNSRADGGTVQGLKSGRGRARRLSS